MHFIIRTVYSAKEKGYYAKVLTVPHNVQVYGTDIFCNRETARGVAIDWCSVQTGFTTWQDESDI